MATRPWFSSSCVQVRSQDLKKGGGGFFERVRKVQTTFSLFLNQNHTVCPNCPKIERKFLGNLGNSNAFFAQKQVLSKKKKVVTEIGQNRKFKHFFWPIHDIYFTTSAPNFLWGERGLFSIFHQKLASKAPKTFDFAYCTSQANGGDSSPLPPPPSWLRYWLCLSRSSVNYNYRLVIVN